MRKEIPSLAEGDFLVRWANRSLGELSLSETAYLAALPKAPNAYNIARHEKEAYARRDYVLSRMQADGYITAEEAAAAKAERLVYRKRSTTDVVTADFFAEEVRRNLMAAYGEKGLYEGGLTVSTTLDPAIQEQADKALRDGLIAYDRRHGWRGPHAKIADMSVPWEEEFARIQQRRPLFGPSSWQLAVVTKVDAGSATVAGLPDNADGTIPFAEMTWARQSLPNQNVGAAPARPAALLGAGDVVLRDVSVLLQFLEAVLRMPTDVSHRHLRILGLVLRDFDELLAALLGELRDEHTDDDSVRRRVHTEIRITDRLLDRRERTLVIRRDDHHAGFRRLERRQLRERCVRSVVVDRDLLEHRRGCTAGANGREIVLRYFDSLVHLLFGLEEDVIDHVLLPVVMRVPIFSPRTARAMLPSTSRLNTWIGSELSWQRLMAVASATFNPRVSTS